MGGSILVEARWLAKAWVVTGALLAWGCNSQLPQEPTKPAAAVVAELPRWASGKRYVYASTLQSKLVLSGQTMMGFDLAAKLALETREVSGETEFIAQLSEGKFKAESAANQAQFDALAHELERPFGFSQKQGKLSSLQLPEGWSPFAISISRTLAAGLQLAARSADQKGSGWTATEVDATGHYDVEYTPKQGEPNILSKRKLRYASVNLGKITIGQFGAKVAPEVLESAGSVTLGRGSHASPLSLVDYREKLKVQLTPTSLVDSETTLKLAHQPPSAAGSFDWATALTGTKTLAPDDVPTTLTPSTSYDPERIGNYTFETALAELEKQARDSKRRELVESARGEPYAPEQLQEREQKLMVQSRAFSALAALFRTDKKNIGLAVAKVRAQSPALRGLLDALSAAGNPEAQAALVGLMNDAKLQLPVRRSAAFSLSRTEHASPDSVSALQAHLSASDPIQVHALYGLGTIARRLRTEGQVARSESVVSALVGVLGTVSIPQQQVDVLRAIANSGGSSAFDAVKPYLDEDATKVRVAALDALRLMSRPEVDGIIAEKLRQPEAELQIAALDAISVRAPSGTLLEALKEAGISGAKPSVRVKAVRIMAQLLPQRPELRASLESIAEKDEKEQVRKAAKLALGT